MAVMSKLADNAYDLAICDPPYGIGEHGKGGSRHKPNSQKYTVFEPKHWDNEPPPAEYFDELRRVSKNQIIWGGNYFTEHLPPSMGWVFWDKLIGGDFSDGELAFTSFQRALKKFTHPPFHNRAVRYRMHEANVQQGVKEARRKLGIMVLPHELRHAYATHCLERGTNIKALKEAMGHAQITTTEGYCHAEALSVKSPLDL